jgi:chromosome segregation ATPase
MPTTEELKIQLERDPVKRQELERQVAHQHLENEYYNTKNMNEYLKGKLESVKGGIDTARKDIQTLKSKLKDDTPNQYLKDLQQKILKAKDAAKRAELQSDFDKKLAGSRTHIKNMIEAKQKRTGELSEQMNALQKEIKTSNSDLNDAAKRLREWEDVNMNDKGEIITDFEEVC